MRIDISEGPKRRRAGWCGGLLALPLLAGCYGAVGGVPQLALADGRRGLKMLRPHMSTMACRTSLFGQRLDGEPDLALTTLTEMLRVDEEATLVVNAKVEWTSWTTGVYGRECVTLTGDVMREASMVLIPMSGEHGNHAGRSEER